MAVRNDGKIHALLATARIANVPSVLSNLAVGVFLGGLASAREFVWPGWLLVAGVLFYVSGNVLNDWADLDWDKEKRPERALPRGMFSARSYLLLSIGGFTIATLLTALYGIGVLGVSLLLVALILLYTFIHKKTFLSVVPMGLCRACLPVMGYLAMRESLSPFPFYPALALLIYIVALSLSARWESMARIPPEKIRLSRGLLIASGWVAVCLPMQVNPMLGWIGLVPFGIVLGMALTRYRTPVPAHVSALLAGIPMLDWVVTLPLALTCLGHQSMSVPGYHLLIAIALPPLALISGRWMQRIAPAT